MTEAEIRARLRGALRGSGVLAWPSRSWVQQHVGADVVAAIDRTGGPGRWARELGLPFVHRHGHRWTPETIAAALERLLAGRSTWPCRREFEEAGLGGLYGAIRRPRAIAALAARYGLSLQRPGRHRADAARAAAHHRLTRHARRDTAERLGAARVARGVARTRRARADAAGRAPRPAACRAALVAAGRSAAPPRCRRAALRARQRRLAS